MDQELVQYLEQKFQSQEQQLRGLLDQRFEAVDRRFEQVDRQFVEMRQEMHTGFDEVKRHAGVLVEDLRYQVQLVAEGFATFVEGRYSEDQARIDERFRETHALIRTSFKHLARQETTSTSAWRISNGRARASASR